MGICPLSPSQADDTQAEVRHAGHRRARQLLEQCSVRARNAVDELVGVANREEPNPAVEGHPLDDAVQRLAGVLIFIDR
jgi:hypothetical protein